jgi:hypothetical protein
MVLILKNKNSVTHMWILQVHIERQTLLFLTFSIQGHGHHAVNGPNQLACMKATIPIHQSIKCILNSMEKTTPNTIKDRVSNYLQILLNNKNHNLFLLINHKSN